MLQSRRVWVHTVLRAREVGILLAMAIVLWGVTAVLADTLDTFTNTGMMTTPRASHTATLLPSGQVLVVGGSATTTSVGALASAELYDPATGLFSATGTMAVARSGHTATLLPSGQVLVAGGDTPSAELYDPATGLFSPTGAMAVARSGHTATLLPNGQVLVVGPTSAELYNPATGLFSATGMTTVVRGGGYTATLLPSGQVLVTGGLSLVHCLFAVDLAELYDPATGLFRTTGGMVNARYDHTATLLPSEKVLVAGGQGAGPPCSFSSFAAAELYDSATGLFSPTGSMTTARELHTATRLPSGQVLVAGGSPTTIGGALAAAELYDPATGLFSATGSMMSARINHTATLLPSGQVLVAGGSNTSSALASAELYTPIPLGGTVCIWGLYIDDHHSGGNWETRLFLANLNTQQAHNYAVAVLATDTVHLKSLRLGPSGMVQLNCGDLQACGTAGWLQVNSDAPVFGATLFVVNNQLGGGSFTAQSGNCTVTAHSQ